MSVERVCLVHSGSEWRVMVSVVEPVEFDAVGAGSQTVQKIELEKYCQALYDQFGDTVEFDDALAAVTKAPLWELLADTILHPRQLFVPYGFGLESWKKMSLKPILDACIDGEKKIFVFNSGTGAFGWIEYSDDSD